MRIVAGKFRGRALVAPSDRSIRPTSDRVREAMFNALAHGAAAVEFEGARVIDLFAGTGALALEAVSRGAAYGLLVEESAEARGLIRENIEALGLTGCTRIFRRDATDLGPAGNIEPFGLAFLDPPYGKGLADRALVSLLDGGWLNPGAVIVVEEKDRIAVAVPPALTILDQRSYGDTQVMLIRRHR